MAPLTKTAGKGWGFLTQLKLHVIYVTLWFETAARSSAGVNVRAGLKLRQLGDFTPGEDFAPQAHRRRMLRDALLIALCREQPPSIAASLARHVLEFTPTLGKKQTLLGPAPVVPDTAVKLVLVCVMHLGLIICDVTSNELQNLRLSLSQMLYLIENWANALIWSFSYESSTAYLAQIGAKAIRCARFQPCPCFMEDEAARGAAFSFGLQPFITAESCRPLPWATRCLLQPLCSQSMERSLSAKTAPAHRPWRLLCNVALAVQKSHPVPST